MKWAALCAGLVLAGALLSPRWAITDTLDGQYYAAMSRGAPVPAPYRYRVLVPLLARLIPVAPDTALRLLTYAGLLAAYILTARTIRAFGLSDLGGAAGLLALIVTPTHASYFTMPYLTDGLGLAAVCALVWARVTNHYAAFLVLLVLGGLIRETPLVLAPCWGWSRRSGVAVAVAVVTGAGLRLLLGWEAAPTSPPAPHFARHVLIGWHVVWVLAPLGLWRLADRRAWWIAGCLAAGTAASLIVGTDTLRLLAALGPAMALGVAGLTAGIRR